MGHLTEGKGYKDFFNVQEKNESKFIFIKKSLKELFC